eukprot:CAMPEP_0114587270 /NCGR_PEP_ID=MMETSP0125-20121206/10274_1 /TAXON_ID=485358 ORGANISM="Aristerostoma sp., Strain ATCC 50986" /NCGR_SAMPLE_ID=MMETSP0125 /ASSEMBLY_ACC=CAM_ASM_000245 /LENGTH=131 /DNA_ID=CAMNT_0001783101 /DNA_START=54 /DNA_END=449 /DNA_ORIENTATION=-
MTKSTIVFALLASCLILSAQAEMSFGFRGIRDYLFNSPQSVEEDVEQFFEGLGKGLGNQDAAKEVIQCVTIDSTTVIADVKQLMTDLKEKKWAKVFDDGNNVLEAIKALVGDCKSGSTFFVNEFAPFIAAY